MAYDGYLTFAGQEIANRARLNAYMSAFMPGLLRDCDCACDSLAAAVGDPGYSTPFGDEAPWTDQDDPDSGDFYGVLINSMRGIDDSVRRVSYSEAVGSGGTISGSRQGVREVRFTMTAFASSDAGMEAGWRWLKMALAGDCDTSECDPGSQLCFFSACPPVGTPLGEAVTRNVSLHSLTSTSGSWDGRRLVAAPGAGVSENPQGYWSVAGSTETDPGYWVDVDDEESPEGYWLGGSIATLRTPALQHPIDCGPASWTFRLSGSGRATVQVVLAGEVIAQTTVDLSETPTDVLVSEQGMADRGQEVHAQVLGKDVTVHQLLLSQYELPEPGDDCSDGYLRAIRDVAVIDGPRVRGERETSTGGIIREFEFTAAAMTPAIFGLPREVASTYRGQTSVRRGAQLTPWSGAMGLCQPEMEEPLLDPNCLPLAPLPYVPSIPLGCGGVDPSSWTQAYLVRIPGTLLKTWSDMVPVLELRTDEEVRGVRARFFPRLTDDWELSDLDPCSACGTFEVSYIPENSTFTIDGMSERAFAQRFGGRNQAADHLISSGHPDVPFTWPELSCGIGYFLLVEVAGADLAGLTLRLAAKE